MSRTAPSARRRVVVVGGGLAGLVAAFEIGADPAYDVWVLEGSAEPGGKLRLAEVAGVAVDVGAEAMLARRPEGVALARRLGLEVAHPATSASRVWTRGALRPLPRSLMGVPLDLDDLAASGVLSARGLARVRAGEPGDLAPPAPGEDLSVARLVGDRLGTELVDRLVDPLLGGVYAGRAAELSARATVPQLVARAERGPLLVAGPAEPAGPLVSGPLVSGPSTSGRSMSGPSMSGSSMSGPVFAGIPGGMGRLVAALVGSGRFRLRTEAPVRALHRAGPGAGDGADGIRGFRLTVGSAANPEVVEAADVVLATPAAAAARLLAGEVPAAAARLAEIESASVAVVTLAFRARDLLPDGRAGSGRTPSGGWGSGFLVPAVDGRRIKAATFSFAKWDWVRAAGRKADGEDLLLLRTSLGRHREERTLQVPDEDLVAASRADLRAALGLSARPVDAQVQRWGGGLPQYLVGHGDRVAGIRSALAASQAAAGPGAGWLAVCGAAYDGVGIPAVISSARRAAAQVVTRPGTMEP